MRLKKILILGVALSLSSCGHKITQKEISQANEYCKDKGGVFSILVRGRVLTWKVTCRNGDLENSNNVKK